MHDIIIALLGCGVPTVIATAIITAINNRKGRLKEIEDTLKRIDDRFDGVDMRFDAVDKRQNISEKDALRTQLLLLISDYPDNQEGIMQVAQRYFGELDGNWYATSLFNHWLEKNGIAKPEWFDK